MIKIKYFLNNVDQCWTCNNCIGSSPLMSFSHLDEHINCMIEYEKGDRGMILLPECKVIDSYMLEVYHRSCPYYEVKKHERKVSK